MGELGVAKASDGIEDALLAGVPPESDLYEVRSEVGHSVLATEERRESARAGGRGQTVSDTAWSGGREALGGSTGPMVSGSGTVDERSQGKGAVDPRVRSKIGYPRPLLKGREGPQAGGLKKGLDGLRRGAGKRDAGSDRW